MLCIPWVWVVDRTDYMSGLLGKCWQASGSPHDCRFRQASSETVPIVASSELDWVPRIFHRLVVHSKSAQQASESAKRFCSLWLCPLRSCIVLDRFASSCICSLIFPSATRACLSTTCTCSLKVCKCSSRVWPFVRNAATSRRDCVSWSENFQT